MTAAATLDRTEAPTTRLRVTGMNCASCMAKVEAALRRLPNVTQGQVSIATETLAVHHGPGSDGTAIATTVRKLGYDAEDLEATVREEADEIPWWRAPKALIAFACGGALLAAYTLGHAVPATERWATDPRPRRYSCLACPLGQLRLPDRLRRPRYQWSKRRHCTNFELGPPRGDDQLFFPAARAFL